MARHVDLVDAELDDLARVLSHRGRMTASVGLSWPVDRSVDLNDAAPDDLARVHSHRWRVEAPMARLV